MNKTKAQEPRQTRLQSFYYTYGSWEGYPFQGGWTVVRAQDRKTADRLFRRHHADRTPGVLNCAFVYTWEEFVGTGMAQNGCCGIGCREIIEENGVKEVRV